MDNHLKIDVQLALESEREFMETVYPYLKNVLTKEPFIKDKAVKGLSALIQRYMTKQYKNQKSYFYKWNLTNWKAERQAIAKDMVEFAITETELNGYIFDKPFKIIEQ